MTSAEKLLRLLYTNAPGLEKDYDQEPVDDDGCQTLQDYFIGLPLDLCMSIYQTHRYRGPRHVARICTAILATLDLSNSHVLNILEGLSPGDRRYSDVDNHELHWALYIDALLKNPSITSDIWATLITHAVREVLRESLIRTLSTHPKRDWSLVSTLPGTTPLRWHRALHYASEAFSNQALRVKFLAQVTSPEFFSFSSNALGRVVLPQCTPEEIEDLVRRLFHTQISISAIKLLEAPQIVTNISSKTFSYLMGLSANTREVRAALISLLAHKYPPALRP